MRALIVAYYFPPRGGAGTQRFAKFCKFLPQYGVQPTVLTSAVDDKTTHAPHDDATLLRETATEVVRVGTPARAGLGARLRRTLRLHVDADEWAAAAAERAVVEARARRSEVVVTTLSPFAAWRVGARVQRELGIPWVVDLRDPWSLDGWRIFLTEWHARRDLAEMRTALQRADFVIANVPAARTAFLELGADPGRTVVIPNGYDDEDFAAATVAARTDQRFQLAHIGTFHGLEVGAGMTRNRLRRVRHRQLEPLGRTGHYLLQALAAWRREPSWQGRGLMLHLYGQVDASHRALIAELGIGDLVTLHGYVEHRASVAALLAADAVFVPLHGVPAGERALVVPGKLYEALASERPILAALPPGDGADLVRQLDAGTVVPPTDSAAIAAALGRWTLAHAAGALPRGVARARLQPFTRQALTGLLAQVLEAAVRRAPAVEVRDPWQQLGIRSGG
jgi:glycosyltransferase involved in cell wall biosynthesis